MILEVTTQQVVQLFPEEHQPLITTLAAIAMAIFSVGALLWPFISKWASNRQIAAIESAKISQEDIALALESKLNDFKKAETIKKIAEWEYKLIYATTEEAKQMCNAEIVRLKAELDTFA